VEGRVLVVCAECGRRREVSGEMPEDYLACFQQIVAEEGFVPRPGVSLALICGACAATYKGSETADDEAKIKM
jgi:hypothetical protein